VSDDFKTFRPRILLHVVSGRFFGLSGIEQDGFEPTHAEFEKGHIVGL
jgi:hypothetical protein